MTERRAVSIAITSACLNAETIDASIERWAVAVDAAFAIKDAAALFAAFPRRAGETFSTVDIRDAERVEALLPRGTVTVSAALTDEDTAVPDTVKARATVRADFTFDREDTAELITNKRLWALGVIPTFACKDAESTAAALPIFTVAVSEAASVGNADPIDTALTDGTWVQLITAFRGDTAEVTALKTRRTVSNPAALTSKEANSRPTALSQTAILVSNTLWSGDAAEVFTNLIRCALRVHYAPGRLAATFNAAEACAAIAVSATFA